MKYCRIVMIILLWFIAFVNCDKDCKDHEGEKKCSVHYQLVDGACVACPKGWMGNECNESCPNGYYGVLCTETCNCTDDQICDAQDGCVQNKTVDTLTKMETTSIEHKTTKSNKYHGRVLWNHLYGVPLGVVIIVLVILLVHTHRKNKTSGQEDESQHCQHDQEAGSQLNQNPVHFDYAEISEIDATYSHTLTFSSDYNVLSTSRSRRDRSESRPTESHYDTSKNCLLKVKESESKSKPDAGGNPYSLAKPLTDTGNEVQQAKISKVKEGDIE